MIEHTVQDLRFAARRFARAPIAPATMIGIFAMEAAIDDNSNTYADRVDHSA